MSPLSGFITFVNHGTSGGGTAVSASLADCRAPYLFAAVLQQAGAGQELLPLLADPARAAFQGLSITARHHRAFHIHPFLQVKTTLTAWNSASVSCSRLCRTAHRAAGPLFTREGSNLLCMLVHSCVF